MRYSQACTDLVKDSESCKLEAYLCPAGVWTIGWGHTRGVRRGQKITQAEADQLLQGDLDVAAASLASALPMRLPLTQGQVDALTSFVFNLGIGNFKNSTLRKKILAGDMAGAAEEFLRWVKGVDPKTKQLVTLNGLVTRRKRERALFLG
jgi:lysozyme